ncbi:MAG: serine hydrolase domain-containing protein [Myxococcota bacterium]|nr:beta-lactamase family protein [Myxococcales bacterium]
MRRSPSPFVRAVRAPGAALAAAVALAAACALASPARAGELPTARPKSVGLSAERLARLGTAMQRYIDEGKVAGIVTAVARDGKVVHLQTQGAMDFESGRPMQADAIFRIYSMSKPIAATALMMLHEQGAFALSDPVAKFLPELGAMKVMTGFDKKGQPVLVDAKSPMTMRQMLSHTAGLGYGIIPEGLDRGEDLYRAADLRARGTTLAEFVPKLAKLPLLYPPGTDWRYSLANDVQGRLVEVLSGVPFDRFLAERIFGPLDMRDTGFFVPAEKLDRFTSNYVFGEGGRQLVDGPEHTTYGEGVTFFSGGGGLVSTTRDYLRFCEMLLRGGELDGARILGPKTIELMTMNHMPDGVVQRIAGAYELPGRGYGLGFGMIVDRAKAGTTASNGTYWWGGAANTGFWIDPKERLTGVVMTQRFPGELPLGELMQTLVFQAIEY